MSATSSDSEETPLLNGTPTPAGQANSDKVGVSQANGAQVGVGQANGDQVGVGQANGAQVGVGQANGDQVNGDQVVVGQANGDQVGVGQANGDQVGVDQANGDQVNDDQVGVGQANGAQVGVGQVNGAQVNGDQAGDASLTSFKKWFGVFLHVCFYALSFLSGQLMLDFIRPQNAKLKRFKVIIFLFEFPLILLFLCLNTGVLVFNFWTIFACPLPNCGYIAGPLELYPYNASSEDPSTDLNQEYFDLHKLEFTMATLAGSLSYFIMMYILITHYSVVSTGYQNKISSFHKWFRNLDLQNRAPENEETHTILNPFLHEKEDDGDDYQKVVLYAKQICCFYLIFFLSIALFAANVTIFFVIAHAQNIEKDAPDDNKKYQGHEYIIYVGLAALFSSQYCAIISCFIFSKVTYAVTIKCSKQIEEYKTCIQRVEETSKILHLQNRDREFVKLSKRSMKPYRFWFAVHWFLYAVTAFVSLAYLTEMIIKLLYGYLGQDCQNDTMCYLRIVFESLFTLQHMILFLYPCVRAASILESRKSLIEKFSNEDIDISTALKFNFLQYMKEQRCGFMLSVFCARVEFGFNVAYLSVFLGLLGIVFKLHISL